ncbi:unnamed protein product [Rotaria socialis]|uniref:Uncharacterized protein n=1 Tax=Rotaria socialis TaxID=392032 RepID=A0A820FN35_9BILA|nr:unnamed protein product [Rotaria socialis]CAF4263688.1 unnamed protein product [Rotaria socialis]
MHGQQPMSFNYPNPSRIMSGTSFQHPEQKQTVFSHGQSNQAMSVPSQYHDHAVFHSNSLKNNRIAPQPSNLNSHAPRNNSFRTVSEMQSTRTVAPSSQMDMNHSRLDTNYRYHPNQSYAPQNLHTNAHTDDDFQQNDKQDSCWSKPLCYGLTRLTGGILFGTMIVLGSAAIIGFLASLILYITDPTTNPQWKVLGITVSVVMLVTVIATLCLFIYCYKKGRVDANGDKNNSFMPEYIQDHEFGKINNYVRSNYMSPVPYETIHNSSSLSANSDVIHVTDKQTNTETTMSPLRIRDIQCGVWPAQNAYGGVSNRPLKRRRMTDQFVQTALDKMDQLFSLRNHNSINIAPRNNIGLSKHYDDQHHRRHNKEQYPNSFTEPKIRHEPDENTMEKSKGWGVKQDAEFSELPTHADNHAARGKKTKRFNHVTIKRIAAADKPDFA